MGSAGENELGAKVAALVRVWRKLALVRGGTARRLPPGEPVDSVLVKVPPGASVELAGVLVASDATSVSPALFEWLTGNEVGENSLPRVNEDNDDNDVDGDGDGDSDDGDDEETKPAMPSLTAWIALAANRITSFAWGRADCCVVVGCKGGGLTIGTCGRWLGLRTIGFRLCC